MNGETRKRLLEAWSLGNQVMREPDVPADLFRMAKESRDKAEAALLMGEALDRRRKSTAPSPQPDQTDSSTPPQAP